MRVTLGLFDPELPDSRELPDGAQPLDLLGNSPWLNVRMARKLAVAVIAQLDTGINPVDALRQKRNAMTLGELFEHYRANLVSEGKKSVVGTVWHFQRHLGALPDAPRKAHGQTRTKAPGGVNWERRSISKITRSDVSKLRLELGEKTGHTTANRTIELLRAVYNFGKKEGLCDGENPAAGSGMFTDNERERFLWPDEVQRFFKSLDDEDNRDFSDYVRLSLFTGARRSNVLRMRWDELSIEGARWTVSGETMKNGKPLTVRLVDVAAGILRRRVQSATASPWVFPGKSSAGHRGPFRAQWARLVKNAELADIRIHDLRRSLGSWMAGTGSSTVLTMQALGHKSINAALVYQRLADDPVLDGMQRAADAISQAAREPNGRVIEMRGARKNVAARR